LVTLTVGICAYNEAWNIGNLLENILQSQAMPEDSEIITVCSGCEDNTPEIIRKFSEKDSRVRLIEEPRRVGKAAAVNRILSEAKGDKIIFISADVTPKPGCFSGLITAMKDLGVGISCGKPEPIQRGSPLVRGIVETLWGFHNWQLEKLNHAGLLMHASEVFCIRGGIVPQVPQGTVNDDAFLAVATKDIGYSIKYVPSSRVQVYGPQNLSDYLNQRRRIIVGHYQVRKITGKFSQYLFYSLLAKPKPTIAMVVEYFVMARRLGGGLAAAFIEVVANLLALSDVIRRKSHAVWSISRTTKTAAEL